VQTGSVDDLTVVGPLQQIIARDDAPLSASTLLRELNNLAARLFRGYLDQHLGPHGPNSLSDGTKRRWQIPDVDG
jgi:hypothetical protein